LYFLTHLLNNCTAILFLNLSSQDIGRLIIWPRDAHFDFSRFVVHRFFAEINLRKKQSLKSPFLIKFYFYSHYSECWKYVMKVSIKRRSSKYVQSMHLLIVRLKSKYPVETGKTTRRDEKKSDRRKVKWVDYGKITDDSTCIKKAERPAATVRSFNLTSESFLDQYIAALPEFLHKGSLGCI
jgi:hypothetical protein